MSKVVYSKETKSSIKNFKDELNQLKDLDVYPETKLESYIV